MARVRREVPVQLHSVRWLARLHGQLPGTRWQDPQLRGYSYATEFSPP